MRLVISLRLWPVLLFAEACASFRYPGPQPAPLTQAQRRVYGCYAVSFPATAGDPGTWQVRLDSTFLRSDTAQRLAEFLAPKGKWSPALYWYALPGDSLQLRSVTGMEGQGVEVTMALRGDSLAGTAVESWSFGGSKDRPLHLGSAVGTRISCPTAKASR